METEYYLTFEIYLEKGVCVDHLQVSAELFYKHLNELEGFPGVDVELHSSWEDTVTVDGVKYAKIRSSYTVNDVTNSDLEIGYFVFYVKLDEDDEKCEF